MTDTSKREAVAKALDALGVTVVYADDPVDGSRIQVVLLDDLARIGDVQEPGAAPTVRDHVRCLTEATDAELDELGGLQGEPTDAEVERAVADLRKRFGASNGTHAWVEFQGDPHFIAEVVLRAAAAAYEEGKS